MARKLSHTLIVQGELVAISPIHIGGAEEGILTDMPLAVDGLGRYYLPGTSLGGAIRAFDNAADDDECWGFALGQDAGTASRVIIDDAPALGQPSAELWHGNGIDRRTGTAAEQVKYDREVLPAGTRFALHLTLEVIDVTSLDTSRAWLQRVVTALEVGLVPFGAGTTRGLGRLRLDGTRCHERTWNSPEGVLAFLSELANPPTDCRAQWKTALAGEAGHQHSTSSVRLTLHWRPRGPLMSKSARDGVVLDTLPFLSRRADRELALTLPGAGIKGAWRSHAERIVRTVTGQDYAVNDAQHFRQVEVPLVGNLFGRARSEDRAQDQLERVRHKGRLAVQTCYAEFALTPEEWDKLERSEAEWRAPPHPDRPLRMAMHVAVDRWTGGAAERLLYSALEPERIDWEPIVMHFDTVPTRATETDEPSAMDEDDSSAPPWAEFALLWLTLKDFCAGYIPLGFGVNRGYGDLAVDRVELSGLKALGHEVDTVNLSVTDRQLDATAIAPLIERAKSAWQEWLREE